MWTGALTTWGPSPSGSRGGGDFANRRASESTSVAAMPYRPKKAAGSRPWSSRMPSCETVSKVTLSPESIVSAGAVVRQGSRPQPTVSGVARR